jgi:hypothetical protein
MAQWGGNPARALADHQIGSITQPAPVQPIAHYAPSQERKGQRDHLDEHAHKAGKNTTNVQIRRDRNDKSDARRADRRREAPGQMQSGGKI